MANDVAALFLRSVLSDELGMPFMSLLCLVLGEGTDGCGRIARSGTTPAETLQRGARDMGTDGVVEAAVVALATWGMVTVSLLVGILPLVLWHAIDLRIEFGEQSSRLLLPRNLGPVVVLRLL